MPSLARGQLIFASLVLRSSTIANLFILLGADCSLRPTSDPNDKVHEKFDPSHRSPRRQIYKIRLLLHFYTESIPYPLVSKSKDGATASIFYLKDPKSIVYVQQHQGWGTTNFAMSLSNGVLSAYGMQTDSKGPETIAAVSSLLSSAAIIKNAKTATEADV
jgi:hypothetical protein